MESLKTLIDNYLGLDGFSISKMTIAATIIAIIFGRFAWREIKVLLSSIMVHLGLED
jgi:hypothetical protein